MGFFLAIMKERKLFLCSDRRFQSVEEDSQRRIQSLQDQVQRYKEEVSFLQNEKIRLEDQLDMERHNNYHQKVRLEDQLNMERNIIYSKLVVLLRSRDWWTNLLIHLWFRTFDHHYKDQNIILALIVGYVNKDGWLCVVTYLKYQQYILRHLGVFLLHIYRIHLSIMQFTNKYFFRINIVVYTAIIVTFICLLTIPVKSTYSWVPTNCFNLSLDFFYIIGQPEKYLDHHDVIDNFI